MTDRHGPLSVLRAAALITLVLAAAAPPLHAAAGEYVVTLAPVAAVDGTEPVARRLASTYGGSVVETAGEKFVMRIDASRARLLAADPSVESIAAVAAEPAAEAVVEAVNWTAGVAYTYDGSGNIRQIGDDRFVYDSALRLVQAEINDVRRDFDYDAVGNRKKCRQTEGDCQLGFTVDSANNRIEQAGYDAGGNVEAMNGHTYTYDAVNMQMRDVSGSSVREFIYTADDERLAVYSSTGASWRWTVRDVSGKVLREFSSGGPAGHGNWEWTKDYVWRDGLLLASQQPERGLLEPTRYHYHLDHLGTPRRITNQRDRIVGVHDYHAFGTELAGGTDEPSLTPLKYTGHERDEGGLDYLHARFYSPSIGRFLSVDPTWESADIAKPQTWNRYAYVANNPVRFVDPDGRLQKDKNGDIVFQKTHSGKVTFLEDAPTTDGKHVVTISWEADFGYVYADDGTPIEASKATTPIEVTVEDLKGNVVQKGGASLINSAYDNSTDCHGVTFAKGQVWINNDQVPKILKGDGYKKTTTPGVGSVGVYTTNGHPRTTQHSVTVTGVDAKGKPAEVYSKGGITPPVTTTPGPGTNTGWHDPKSKLTYYEKKSKP